tara:strand:- start:2954 stop:3253 length:300 start_codon:yes stop_codon:yes gene_type:complete
MPFTGKRVKGVIFNGYVRDTSINAPIRIGELTVFPGDIVFANEYGVVFIPTHMVEALVAASELTGLRDYFEKLLLQLNKYPGGEIHRTWSNKIKEEFRA